MPYLFTDEWAWQSDNGPEENATAQDDLSVEAVAQVTKDGSRHHKAADEDWGRKQQENVTLATKYRQNRITETVCAYSLSTFTYLLCYFAASLSSAVEVP